jgi:N-acetylmuramoyl-L-alanine amidase
MAYFITPNLAIIDRPADARHTSGPRTSFDIRTIVLHATAGPLASSLDWLTTNPNSNVSAHRVIAENGQIYKLVDDLVIANHVGYSQMGNRLGLNRETLGIELVNSNSGIEPYEDAQIDSAALQIREWWGRFGALGLVTHAAIDTKGKTDPAGLPFPKFYTRLFARLGEVL